MGDVGAGGTVAAIVEDQDIYGGNSLSGGSSNLFKKRFCLTRVNFCTRHFKIGGLSMFQKVLIHMLPVHVFLLFEKWKLCTLMNNLDF